MYLNFNKKISGATLLLHCLLAILILCCRPQPLLAQTAAVTGNVTDEHGAPLKGASVAVKGAPAKTLTDANGRFEIKAEAGSILVISSVGYTTQETKTGISPLVVRLKMLVTELNTVRVNVSTGYQDIPKERVTGSFTHIDNKLFNEQISTDILSRLEATATGVEFERRTLQPGILVRGLSTIQGVRGPLIVLDNFPYEGDINNINPNDVESITILKDAAAASIWGTKAGNGVIVITTKKAKLNQPFKAEFNSAVMVGNKPDLFYQPQMSSSDYIDVELMLYSKGYFTSQINSTSKPALTPVVEILLKKTAGTISAADADAQINALRYYDVRNDFNHYMYQKSVKQQYALSLSGGSQNMSWIFSTGYDRNQSDLAAGYNRLNLRLNNTWRPNKNLQMMASIYFTNSRSTAGKPGLGEVTYASNGIPPYTRFADENGNPLPVPSNFRQSYKETAGNGKLLDWNYYPLTDYANTDNASNLQDLTGNISLNYKLFKGLSADVKYQYERQANTSENLKDQNAYSVRNMINTYTQINATTGAVTYKVPLGGIYDVSNSSTIAQNIRAQLNYSTVFGDHELTVITGGELKEARSSYTDSRAYGFDPNILKSVNVDYTTPYPSFVSGSTSLISSGAGYGATNNRFVSAYANAAYTFKEKYTLSGSARRDASNLFGVNTNDKWTPLWSAGAAWDLSKEKFYNWKAIPYLKLRVSYGYSGNVDQARSALTTLTYGTTSAFTSLPYASITKYANPELRWERVITSNVAIDFSALNNRISGSIEYYDKRGIDLYGTEEIDITAGVGSTVARNVASMRGSGVDIDINSMNTTGKLKWNTRYNFSFNRDKVTENYKASPTGHSLTGGSSPNVVAQTGYPVYAVFAHRWAGLDPLTGDPRGYLKGAVTKDYTNLLNATTTPADMLYMGPVRPTAFGSLGNTVSYRNLSLTATLTYKLGSYFKRSSLSYTQVYGRGLIHGEFAQRWQNPGDELVTNVPSMTYPAVSNRDSFYAASEINVDKGDLIRLQYVSASYELTKARAKKLPFSRVQASVNISNLGLIWKATKLDLDPDYLNVKPVKTIALGLKASL